MADENRDRSVAASFGVPSSSRTHQRLELVDELQPPLLGERRDPADADHPLLTVRLGVEAEQQGSHALPGLVHAVPVDNGVGGPGVLDLQHRSLARGVCLLQRLGHDPVQAGALEPLEPVPGDVRVGGHLGQVDRVAVLELRERLLEAGSRAPGTAGPSATRPRGRAGRSRPARPASPGRACGSATPPGGCAGTGAPTAAAPPRGSRCEPRSRRRRRTSPAAGAARSRRPPGSTA